MDGFCNGWTRCAVVYGEVDLRVLQSMSCGGLDGIVVHCMGLWCRGCALAAVDCPMVRWMCVWCSVLACGAVDCM